jgi:hypothetical protein
MFWPDPPQCCSHGPNTHGKERCQMPGCGCERDLYLTQRQMALQQAAGRKPAAAPPPPDPLDYRWRLVAHLDNTLEIEINKEIFGDTQGGADAALDEVRATAAELAVAEPAEADDV